MFCCSECFSSTYVKTIINSNSTIGNCDFCGSTNVAIYNPRELGLIFQNIFALYIPSEFGNPIEIQIELDFQGKIFSSKIQESRKDLLLGIVSDDMEQFAEIFDSPVVLRHIQHSQDDVKPLQISWEKFAAEIKLTNRFHIQNVLNLGKLKQLLSRYERRIPKGKIYYRSRLCESVLGFNKADMSNPPAEKTRAGRANPVGISYLYVSNDPSTTLYEIRASLYDYVAVGEFRIEEEIKVVNLRGDTYDPIYLSEQGELEDFLIHLPFITKLEQELSKPRRRSDNELDYLPTQYLCEFVKSMGYDGVEYQSSVYSKGYNLAIYNSTKLNCLAVNVYEIETIDLKYREVPL